MAETDGRTLHAKIIELNNALKVPGMDKHKKKWEREVESLNLNLNSVRAKLDKQINEQVSQSKSARREKRYVGRLEVFGQWLDVVERQLDETLRNDADLDEQDREARLHEIRDICESRALVALKLQNFKFENADQLEQAREYADRYQQLTNRIEKLNLPQPRQIQVSTFNHISIFLNIYKCLVPQKF